MFVCFSFSILTYECKNGIGQKQLWTFAVVLKCGNAVRKKWQQGSLETLLNSADISSLWNKTMWTGIEFQANLKTNSIWGLGYKLALTM